MVKQILKLKEAKQEEVMLMLDANELMGESLDGMQRLVDTCDLHDLHSIHAIPLATYKYGKARQLVLCLTQQRSLNQLLMLAMLRLTMAYSGNIELSLWILTTLCCLALSLIQLQEHQDASSAHVIPNFMTTILAS
jgi:hypothetical protein